MHLTRFVAVTSSVTLFITQTALAVGFTDITTSYPNHEAVLYVQQEGIVSGYPDGSYQPDRFINRAEFVKIVVGATFTPQAWDRCDPNSIYSFNDAGRNEWYSPYLCVAVQNKIIEGYPNGSFMPSLGINFVEAAKILVIADRIDEGGNPRYDRALPEAEGEWYVPYVQYLAARKAIPIGISRLDQNVTRGDMAEMIYRLRAGITDKHSRTYEELASVKMLYSPLYELQPLSTTTIKNYARNTVYAYSVTAPTDNDGWYLQFQWFTMTGGRWSAPEVRVYSDAARTQLLDTWMSTDNWTGGDTMKFDDYSLKIPPSQTRYLELSVEIGTPADMGFSVRAKHPLLQEVTLKSE